MRPRGKRQRAIAVVNTAAGGTGANALHRMRQALRRLGIHEAEVVAFDFGDGAAQLRRLASGEPDAFIVWGGDGTHRTALGTLGLEPSRLVLLPGGTMNLLSRFLHGPAPWDRILEAVLAASAPRPLPAGEIKGERFFCAMLAGAPARFAQARESLRHGQIGRAMGEVGVALDAIHDLHLRARYRNGGAEHKLAETCLVAALVGPLSNGRGMEVAALPHPTVATTLDAIWSSFHQGFRNLPGIAIADAEGLEVDNTSEDAIPVIIDGEAIRTGRRVDVRFVEQGAWCLTALEQASG
jgi:diacylglycerol kinase family enzyme